MIIANQLVPQTETQSQNKNSRQMKSKQSESELEASGFSEKSFINLSKISSSEVTFFRNDDSTSSTTTIEAFLGRRETPKLFGGGSVSLLKENQRPSNKSSSSRYAQHKLAGPAVKKVLIDLRGSQEPVTTTESSLQSSMMQRSKKSSSVMSNSMQMRALGPPEATNVKVFARMKPSNLEETLQRDFVLDVQPNYVRIDGSVYTFDEMFGEAANQQEIFARVAQPTIKDIFEGYNGTIFAYGQTGSGKTYTMFGSQEHKGIIPRTVEHIFELASNQSEVAYKITASMLEIYKQSLSDLFALQPVELKIKQSANGIYVQGLSELQVTNSKTMLGLIDFGEQIRKVSSTRVNQYSSRSHTIIMISIKSKCGNDTRTGKLYLVDLAGSEKVRRSGASGETLEEAKKINLSLSCLGNVINALTTRKKKDHIPYRESKLTRILQDSLSGNCKTSIIVTFSGTQNCIEQTISAMKFAQRAKKITNNIKINSSQRESVDQLYTIIQELQKELQNTKSELQRYKQQTEQQGDTQAPSARLVIPSERANVEASLQNYQSRATLKTLKMSLNLQEISSLGADSRMSSTLHSPSLSSLSLNRSSMASKDMSLNFSIKQDDNLSQSSSVRLSPVTLGCLNPFRK